jgi:hypothetical protein
MALTNETSSMVSGMPNTDIPGRKHVGAEPRSDAGANHQNPVIESHQSTV